MKIALGCDHGGLNLKEEIANYLKSENIEFKDFGTYTEESCDYADIALPVAEAVVAKEFDFGINYAPFTKGLTSQCCSVKWSGYQGQFGLVLVCVLGRERHWRPGEAEPILLC